MLKVLNKWVIKYILKKDGLLFRIKTMEKQLDKINCIVMFES